jgi:hypothetical protein
VIDFSKLFFLLALVSSRNAIAQSYVLDERGYTPVSYCELMRNPMEYDGKRIAVRAGCMLGFEMQVILSVKCRELTSLAFMPEIPKAERIFHKAPSGTSNATFYGIFHKERLTNMTGMHGPHQLDVYYMENIKFISTNFEDLKAALSKKAQQNLIQGDEMPEAPKRNR